MHSSLKHTLHFLSLILFIGILFYPYLVHCVPSTWLNPTAYLHLHTLRTDPFLEKAMIEWDLPATLKSSIFPNNSLSDKYYPACLDGSEPAYYAYPDRWESAHWVINLQGGSFCQNTSACSSRHLNVWTYFSNFVNQETQPGIFLADQDVQENPIFANAQHVFLRYCTQDLWSGWRAPLFDLNMACLINPYLTCTSEMQRRSTTGSRRVPVSSGQGILEVILKALFLRQQHLKDLHGRIDKGPKTVTVMGSSAGGLGISFNADLIFSTFQNVTYYSILDSSMFIVSDPVVHDTLNVLIQDTHKIGVNDVLLNKYRSLTSPLFLGTQPGLSLSNTLFISSYYDLFNLAFQLYGTTKSHSVLQFSNYVYVPSVTLFTKLRKTMHTFMHGCPFHVYLAVVDVSIAARLQLVQGTYTHSTVSSVNWNTITTSASQDMPSSISLKQWITNAYLNPGQNNSFWDDPNRIYSGSCPYLTEAAESLPMKSRQEGLVDTAYSVQNKWILLSLSCAIVSLAVVSILHTLLRLRQMRKVVKQLVHENNQQSSNITVTCLPLDRRIKIELHNLKVYAFLSKDKTKEIVHPVSFTLYPGMLTGLMGLSGSGKTTLFRSIVKDTSDNLVMDGHVFWNDVSIHNLHRSLWRPHIGYVRQFTDSVFSGNLNLSEDLFIFCRLYPLYKNETDAIRLDRTRDVLHKVGLYDKRDRYISSLSGGEQRRWMIARVLLQNSSVFLLDEPTSGLDAASSLELIQMLHGLCQMGYTILVSIHQPREDIAKLFGQILFLKSGKILIQGSHEDICDWAAKCQDRNDSSNKMSLNNAEKNEFGLLTSGTDPESDSSSHLSNPCDILTDYIYKGDIFPFSTIAQVEANPDISYNKGQLPCLYDVHASQWTRYDVVSMLNMSRYQIQEWFKMAGVIIFLAFFCSIFYRNTDSYINYITACCTFMMCVTLISVSFLERTERFMKFWYDWPNLSNKDVISIALWFFVWCSQIVVACFTITLIAVTFILFYNKSIESMLLFDAVSLLTSFTWITILCCIYMSIKEYKTAEFICFTVLNVSLFFTGVFINRKDMPIWLSWIVSGSPSYYGVSATAKLLMNQQIVYCEKPKTLSDYIMYLALNNSCGTGGAAALNAYDTLSLFGMEKEDEFRNLFILWIMYAGYTLLLFPLIYRRIHFKRIRHVCSDDGNDFNPLFSNSQDVDHDTGEHQFRQHMDVNEVKHNHPNRTFRYDVETVKEHNSVPTRMSDMTLEETPTVMLRNTKIQTRETMRSRTTVVQNSGKEF